MRTTALRSIFILPLLLFFFEFPEIAAAGVEFLSTPSTHRTGSGSLMPGNTRFQFSSGKNPVSFHFSGSSRERWLENPMDQSTAVLDYAYVGLPTIYGMDISLGRIRTDRGESLDGMYARKNFTRNADVSFFTGNAVGSANDLTGGRFSYRFGSRSKAGFSYVTESAGADMFREETTLDLRLHPFQKVIVSGQSRVDLLTGTWKEHSYSIKMGPMRKATLFFDASLFDFCADPFDESITLGAGIRYPLSPHLAVRLDMGKTEYSFADTTYSRGMTFSSSFRTWTGDLSVVQRKGTYVDIAEMNARATKRSGALEAFLNLRKIIQDKFSIHNENILSTTLGFAHDLSSGYRIVAGMERSRDAYSQLDLRSFIKLEYRFGA